MRHALLALVCGVWVSLCQAAEKTSPPQFESLTPNFGVYHDVVNVGVIRKNGKALLIDSGEGSILQAARRLGVNSIEWVLYTHHHRDQCSGAGLLKKAGVRIGVPAAESRFFTQATDFWLDADNVIDHRYNFRPSAFVLRSSVEPDQSLKAGETFRWEGLEIQVVPTRGHTDGSVSYIVNIDGQKVAFTGDLIYGPGQLWEFYSLQKGFAGMPYDYWGFGGAVPELLDSLERVLSHQPDLLVPSHGVVMKNPTQAIRQLRENLDAFMANYFTLAAWRLYFKDVNPGYAVPMLPPLPPAKLPAWVHKAVSTSWYVQAKDGTIFLFDAGFADVLNELDRLKKAGTISGIDGVWISHYHDDHVTSVNQIRHRYGAKVYAQKELVDILENPRAYSMPCLFPERIRVDHSLQEGEVIRWKGYAMTGYYFPGQTLYHDGLLVEHDGSRIFLSGDSLANWGIDDYCSQNRNFLGRDNGYEQCLRLLKTLKPDLLVAAHWGALPISEEYVERTLRMMTERKKIASALFPWDDPNFGLDPDWIRAHPYRQSVLKGQTVTLEARIYNHSDASQQASIELRAPTGWQVRKAGPIVIPARHEGIVRLAGVAPANPVERRQVLGLSVRFGQRNLGEVAEAIVDFLE